MLIIHSGIDVTLATQKLNSISEKVHREVKVDTIGSRGQGKGSPDGLLRDATHVFDDRLHTHALFVHA